MWNGLERLEDIPSQLRAEIGHFFAIYKDLEPGKESTVKGWRDREAALRELEEARDRYAARHARV
jgi:inorganic pyrophosphatase